jgi:hypothetical protein
VATSNTSTVKTARTATKSVTPRKAATSKTAAKRPVVKKVSPVKTTRQTTVRAKTAAPKKAAAPVQPAKPVKVTKVKKPKLIRDSFTIPKDEYVVIDALKLRAGKLSQAVKKSELLRAGIKALAAMSDIQFKAALSNVPTIKTGRPKNSK